MTPLSEIILADTNSVNPDTSGVYRISKVKVSRSQILSHRQMLLLDNDISTKVIWLTQHI
jgi:hypothetical protein